MMATPLTPAQRQQIDQILYKTPETFEYARQALQHHEDRHTFVETRAQLFIGVLSLMAGALYILILDGLENWSATSELERGVLSLLVPVTTLATTLAAFYLLRALWARHRRHLVPGDLLPEYAYKLVAGGHPLSVLPFWLQDLIFREYAGTARRSKELAEIRIRLARKGLLAIIPALAGLLFLGITNVTIMYGKAEHERRRDHTPSHITTNGPQGPEGTPAPR